MARILIADDALFMRVMVKKALAQGGHEVVGEAEHGKAVVALFQELQPDMVILDITMPELDGISALREIKAINPNARVMMCSALGQTNRVKEALASGAREFVIKPFTPSKLLEAVEKTLA